MKNSFKWGAAAVLTAMLMSTLEATGPDARLVDAAQRNDAAVVRALLGKHVDVNSRQADGSTALLWASYYGGLDLVNDLLAARANPNIPNSYAETPLSIAVLNSRPSVVERLLGVGADPLQVKPSGETLLMTAARSGNRDVVRMLLARGVPVNARESTLGQTALMWAVARRHPEVVGELLGGGADVNAASVRGSTALHFAVQQSDLQMTERLIAAGADVHARMRVRQIDGFTLGLVETLEDVNPLLLAIAVCRQDGPEFDGAASALVAHPIGERCPASEAIGTLLLDHGADANRPDGSRIPPLHQAVRARMPALSKALLAHGARANEQVPESARQWPGPARRGARTLTPTPAGATPFLVAAWSRNAELMEVLLHLGADPKIATADQTTPLMAAAGVIGRPAGWGRAKASDGPEVLAAVKLALEQGGNIAGVNATGQTALHGAARMGNNEAVQFLVEKGAVLDATDANGDTPLRLAERAEAKSTVELMNRLSGRATVPVPASAEPH